MLTPPGLNVLDIAVRKALVQFYPTLEAIKLVDYKVRIIDSAGGTGAYVRVLIESTDGEHNWTTVGSSTDIIEASWLALSDSLGVVAGEAGSKPLSCQKGRGWLATRQASLSGEELSRKP